MICYRKCWTILLLMMLFFVIGCVSPTLKMTYNSDPPGALLFKGNGAVIFQGKDYLGKTPLVREYELTNEEQERHYAILPETSVRWASGESAHVTLHRVDLRLGLIQQYTFKPPLKPVIDGEHDMKLFQEIVTSLASDSLSILPASIGEEISVAIMDGLEIPDQEDEIGSDIFTSQKPEHIGFIAAYIAKQIYGNKALEGVTIPHTVLVALEIHDINKGLIAAKAKVARSNDFDRDAYNASLNVLVNALMRLYPEDIKRNEKPIDGVYLRDTNNELYRYEEG